jgi:hypothetical protein
MCNWCIKIAAVLVLQETNAIQNREDNIVLNVIIIKKTKTKSSAGQHRSPTNAKVGAGAMVE